MLFLSTLPSIPTGSVPITSWASLAHFIPLASSACFIPWGILGPFHSFLPLTFLWAFAKFFGLPQPNYYILYFWIYWPLNQSHLLIPFFGLIQPVFFFLSISYDSYGLTISFIGAPLGPFAFFWVFLLFCRPLNHYFCYSDPMVFTLLLSFSISFILLGFFCHWALLPKMGINKCHFSKP